MSLRASYRFLVVITTIEEFASHFGLSMAWLCQNLFAALQIYATVSPSGPRVLNLLTSTRVWTGDPAGGLLCSVCVTSCLSPCFTYSLWVYPWVLIWLINFDSTIPALSSIWGMSLTHKCARYHQRMWLPRDHQESMGGGVSALVNLTLVSWFSKSFIASSLRATETAVSHEFFTGSVEFTCLIH